MSSTNGTTAELPIAIIGAGFAGLCMAIRLKQAGIESFTIFEKGDRIGGTWRDNTYPGCACDVPSHLYSFSFERNPNWSRAFSPQPEILAYIEHCADKYDLRRFIRLNTEIRDASFDEESGGWTLQTTDGETIRARIVVAGTGPLSTPAYPELDRIDRFEGETFHSARWNHDFDLTGKRVAVVGTGASAIQFVPQIAPRVERLHIFQRTPPWIISKPDAPYPERARKLFARVPALSKIHRDTVYWLMEGLGTSLFLEPRLMKLRQRQAERFIRESIADPDLRTKVTPDYVMGCKRLLISNDYYPALGRDNVELITDPIAEVTPSTVVTTDGTQREVDAIIFGTGFAVTEFLAPMRVAGRDGVELNHAWRDGAEAYYGMTVAGFPNLFILVGPNTGLGHNSILFMIEAQVHYVMQCIERIRNEGLHSLEVLPERQRSFNRRLQDRMKDVVWSTGCTSWYLDEDGKNFALWPGSTVEYWLRTRRVDRAAFRARPRVGISPRV